MVNNLTLQLLSFLISSFRRENIASAYYTLSSSAPSTCSTKALVTMLR